MTTSSPDRSKNTIMIDSVQHLIKRFIGGGGNSVVFELENLVNQSISAIKISKYPIINNKNEIVRNKRFSREIIALKNLSISNNIVKYIDNGYLEVFNHANSHKHQYLVMERADSTLKDIVLNGNLDIQGKLSYIRDILNAFALLENNGIYHRDIKPDNFLFVKGCIKLADLGLISFRGSFDVIDQENDFIGSRGWICPEVMNKFLQTKDESPYKYDCKIDDKSDIFSLGKLFWFIFQKNVPIGRVKYQDSKIDDDRIYNIITWMLRHSKLKRPNIYQVTESFQPVFKDYII